MCGVCGCGEGETRMEAEQKVLEHTGHAHVHHSHSHNHDHDHDHGHEHNHHEHAHDAHTAEVHMLRDDPAQRAHLVSVEQDILSKNDALAAHNRQHFNSHSVLALNLVSSPGAGKTTLLVASRRESHHYDATDRLGSSA